MKKRFLWLGLSLLLVAALALSSCTTAMSTTTTTTSTTATQTSTMTQTSTTTTAVTTKTTTTTNTTTSETPKYGGKLNVVGYRTSFSSSNWDPTTADSAATYWANPFTQFLLIGDIEGKGPRGTNGYNFQDQETISQPFLTGELAESYEQPDPLTLIFHIRKGVMWTGNAYIGMAPREFTANDAAAELYRYRTSSRASTMYYIDSITAQDKYTLVIKLNTYTPDWLYRIAYGLRCGIIPPETVAAPNGGASYWRNQVGTGPFILTDYVEGSYALYQKNPNYWEKTTINGKQYQVPFVDTLGYPIIVDESTRVASVRTGKIDLALAIPASYEQNLNSTAPNLKIFKYLSNNEYQLLLRCDKGRLADVNVRRALMIGTDLNKLANALYPGGAEINAGPISPNIPSISTPINQYPASTQLLFTYDTTNAKKMLADAGFPSGFTLEVTCQNNTTEQDMMSLLADIWSKIGVTLKINSVTTAAWTTIANNKSYSDILLRSAGNSNPLSALQNKVLDAAINSSNWVDPKAVAMFNQAVATVDPVAQNALFKQLNIYVVDQASFIPMAAPFQLGCYWPWVNNYYQEVEAGYHNYVPMEERIWLNPDQKKAMGY